MTWAPTEAGNGKWQGIAIAEAMVVLLPIGPRRGRSDGDHGPSDPPELVDLELDGLQP